MRDRLIFFVKENRGNKNTCVLRPRGGGKDVSQVYCVTEVITSQICLSKGENNFMFYFSLILEGLCY